MILSVVSMLLTKPGIGLIAAALGFGGGRVKNSGKLLAISTEIKAFEAGVTTDVKRMVAAIKAKL